MVEQASAPSLERGPTSANAAQGAALNASAGNDVAMQAEPLPTSHRDASLPGEPPTTVDGGPPEAGAPSAEPTATIAIASGLEAARSAHGPEGDDDLEHERVFYLTGENFVRRQAMVSTVDHDADVIRATPPPPSVAIAHRRRLRRVVAYAMGTALMLCMVGFGHFLGRSLFSAPANAASASSPPAATAPPAPSPPAPASPPKALAPASPPKAPAPASPPRAPASHASHDKRSAPAKHR